MIHHGGYKILRSSDRDSFTCFDIADTTLYGGTNGGDIIICSLVYDHRNKLKIITDFKVTPPTDTKLNVTITCIAISPCKKYLSIGNCNGVVVIFSIIKKDLLHILYSYEDHKGSISVLKWSKFESHKFFSGGTDGLVVEVNCQRLLESNISDSTNIFNHYLKTIISFASINSDILTTVCQCSSAIYCIDCEIIYCDELSFDAVLVCSHHSVYIFHLPIRFNEKPKFSQIDDNTLQLGCGYFCKYPNVDSQLNETLTGIMVFKNSDKLPMLSNEQNGYNNYIVFHLYTIDGNFLEEVLITKLGNIQDKGVSIHSIQGFVDRSADISTILFCTSENRDLLYVNLAERTIEAIEFTNTGYFSNCTISVQTNDSDIFILHEYPSATKDDVLLIGIDILSMANAGFSNYKGNKPIVIHSYYLYFHVFVKLQKRWRRYYNSINYHQRIIYDNSNFKDHNLNSALKICNEENLFYNTQMVSGILHESIVTVSAHSLDLNSAFKPTLCNYMDERISVSPEIDNTINLPSHKMTHNVENDTKKLFQNFAGAEMNALDFYEYNDVSDVNNNSFCWLKDTAGTWTEKWNDNHDNVLKSKLCLRRKANITSIECESKYLVSFENEVDVDFNISRKLSRQYSVTLDTTNGIGLILSIVNDDNSTVIFVQGFHDLPNGDPSPAKKSCLIDIGDNLMGVNDFDLTNSSVEDIVAILSSNNDYNFKSELRLKFEFKDIYVHNFIKSENNLRGTINSNSPTKLETIQSLSKQNVRKIELWNNTDLGIIIETITHNVLDPVVDWLLPLDIQGNCLNDQSTDLDSSINLKEAEVHFLYMKQRHLYPCVVSLPCISSNTESLSLGSNNIVRDIFDDSWEWRSWYLCANESHYFYWENCSPFLYPLEDTGRYRFTKKISWDESKGEYASDDDATNCFTDEYSLNCDAYIQQLRKLCVGRHNSKINIFDLSSIDHGISSNSKYLTSPMPLSVQQVRITRLNKSLKHLEFPKDIPSALELINIFEKSATQVIDNFPNVMNTLQLLLFLSHSNNLLPKCSEENEKLVKCVLVHWLKTFNPLPLNDRPRLRNIYHNYLDSKMRGFSSGAEYHEFIEVVSDISTFNYLLLTNRQKLRYGIIQLDDIDIFDKMQLKYLPYYLCINDINVTNVGFKNAFDEDKCVSFITLYGCYIDLDIIAVTCATLCHPRALNTIYEIITNDEEYIKHFINIQKYIRNHQKNIKADVFLSNVLSTCGTYYDLKYCLLMQLLGFILKSNEELGIELSVILFPIIGSWYVKYALVGSMHDKILPPIFNNCTDSIEHNIQYDIFEFDRVYENKDSFVASHALMRNEMESESIENGFNQDDCDNNYDESRVYMSEWYYSKRKLYHRYLIKVLFCSTLDNYNTALKNKDLLIEWMYLSFHLITCKIDLTVSITRVIGYRIIDSLIIQKLLILFPIPSADINDTSIDQFRVTSKNNSDNDEVYTFADSTLGMNDIVSALCIKIIVNYSSILELEPLLICDLCMNFGLYGYAIKSHEKHIKFMRENDKYKDIELSALWRILSDSLLILWYDETHRHVSVTIIKEAINSVTKNLYRYCKHKQDDIVCQLSILYNEAFNQYLFTQSNEGKYDDVRHVACIYCDIIFDAVGLQVGLGIVKRANYIVESLPFKYIQGIYCKISN